MRTFNCRRKVCDKTAFRERVRVPDNFFRLECAFRVKFFKAVERLFQSGDGLLGKKHAGFSVDDTFTRAATPERNNGAAARLRFYRRQSKVFFRRKNERAAILQVSSHRLIAYSAGKRNVCIPCGKFFEPL